MREAEESERNKAVVAQFPKLLQTPDPCAIRNLFTDDFQLHDVKFPEWPRGYEGAVRMFTRMNAMMPDIKASIEDMFGAGDKVFVRWRFKGTVTGEFEGRKGDRSRLEAIVFSVYRFRDGRVVEDWGSDMPLPEGHAWRTD
jgi:predicted ester cyclase